jgi:hypothetical protein
MLAIDPFAERHPLVVQATHISILQAERSFEE